jgi:hypothetical protein
MACFSSAEPTGTLKTHRICTVNRDCIAMQNEQQRHAIFAANIDIQTYIHICTYRHTYICNTRPHAHTPPTHPHYAEVNDGIMGLRMSSYERMRVMRRCTSTRKLLVYAALCY